jgi:hypothetical protein
LISLLVIIIKLPDQAMASTPSAPRPPGAEEISLISLLVKVFLRICYAGLRLAAMLHTMHDALHASMTGVHHLICNAICTCEVLA